MEDTTHIYFATMTGNAEDLANDALRKFNSAGKKTTLTNLADIAASKLSEATKALFIVSTWGDGEPPDDAVDFFEELQDASFNLSTLQYAIFGLGDESYPDFNQFAKDLDKELLRLGAKPFMERVDSDIDFDDIFEDWTASAIDKLQLATESSTLS